MGSSRLKLLAFLFNLIFLFSACPALAVDLSRDSEVRQPLRTRPDLPEYLPDRSEKSIVEKPPAVLMPEKQEKGLTFRLEKVVFHGNTVFSDTELQEIPSKYIGRDIFISDLEEIRFRVTKKYVDAGYVNSGALIKSGQSVDDGVVDYDIVEGRLDDIDVKGNGWLQSSYISSRLWPEKNEPFNAKVLQERFQMLLQDPLVEQLHGRIVPGEDLGTANLDLDVVRARPYDIDIFFDNHRPPSTGAERVTFAGIVRNLTSFGDALDASFGICEGANEVAVGFSVPLNSYDTRFSTRYNYNENSIREQPLVAMDVESDLVSFEFSLFHPFIKDISQELSLGVTMAVRNSTTYFQGTPFPFSAGVEEDGKSKVSVLRFVQSYFNRSTSRAFALRSSFNFGVELFGSTSHAGDLPDSQYLSWLGQGQYAHRVGKRLGQVILRGDIQLSNNRLLSQEQFAIGGASTVRGYRYNELVRDNGYVFSVEWRYPLWRGAGGSDGVENILQIAPFMDFGAAWNKYDDPGDNILHSVGVGLLITPFKWLSAEVYWGYDIKKASLKQEHNLQDEGVYFRLRLHSF